MEAGADHGGKRVGDRRTAVAELEPGEFERMIEVHLFGAIDGMRFVADVDILINGLIPGPTNTGIWGRDMPKLQSPDVVYPTARMLATLPVDGPSGRVFWNEKEYPLMDPANPNPLQRTREGRSG